MGDNETGGLQRQFGLLQATALNMTAIIGAGVFITIPLILMILPGPYALLGWLAAGALVLVDSLVWSELGATLPGSGGSYLYLLECYGRERRGRLMAFLFIWQFLLSGPLEIASGLIAMDSFSQSLSPAFQTYNHEHTLKIILSEQQKLDLTISPARLGCMAIGVLILVLLYRRVAVLGRLTVVLWLGVLGVIAWIGIEGFLHFDAARAFDFGDGWPEDMGIKLGAVMSLALYSYLGYYNICYVGEEVRNPGRTIPRAILLSAVLVCVLFAALHLAMLGLVPWREALAGAQPVGGSIQSAGGFHGTHPRTVGRASHHDAANGKLLWSRLRRSAGLFAHPLRSSAGRTLFSGRRSCASEASHPARLAAARGWTDAVLEFLRSAKRHQRPHHVAHPRAVHRPDYRHIPAAPLAAGSAAPLPHLVRSTAVRTGASGLAVRLRHLWIGVHRTECADAAGRCHCFSALVAADRRLAVREERFELADKTEPRP